jgi:flagella basal body P-ring formation protein FlgA
MPAIRASCLCSLLLFALLDDGFAVHLSAAEPSISPAPAAKTFGESDLLALLTATLQRDYVKDQGQLELRSSQPWKTRMVPDAPLTLKIRDLPTTGVTSFFIVRFELLATNQSLGTWQWPVQARVWREIWVARSAAQRGDLVCDSDLARERRDLLALHEPLAEFAAGDATLEFSESIQAGMPLLARYVKLRPVLHRGQIADAIVQDGALSITMKVEVLEDGAPGQIIRARNSDSRHDIRGKVLDQQTILVSL